VPWHSFHQRVCIHLSDCSDCRPTCTWSYSICWHRYCIVQQILTEPADHSRQPLSCWLKYLQELTSQPLWVLFVWFNDITKRMLFKKNLRHFSFFNFNNMWQTHDRVDANHSIIKSWWNMFTKRNCSTILRCAKTIFLRI